MYPVLVSLIAAVALVAWFVAVVAGLLLIRHRRPDITAARMMFSGWIWFDRRSFTAAGQPAWRVFIAAAAAFFAAVAFAVVVGLLAARAA